jgi:exodeoxyribonuclease-3
MLGPSSPEPAGDVCDQGQGRLPAAPECRGGIGAGRRGVREAGTLGDSHQDARMKIATYNVNGVNARLPVLLRWLAESKPDVACLQELKAPDEKFPGDAIRQAGYEAVWHGQKGWNGVAILARGGEPQETRRGVPGDPDDTHSRYIEAVVGGITVGCLYLPNGNPAPGPKFDYKMKWFERFNDYAATLLHRGGPVILAGDYNVIPSERDAHKPERWIDDALFLPQTREAYRRLLTQGWTDALRALYPEERLYTFWDYFRGAFSRNAGIRIDHLLLSPDLAHRLNGAGVDRDVRAQEKTSDHAPVWVDLAAEER